MLRFSPPFLLPFLKLLHLTQTQTRIIAINSRGTGGERGGRKERGGARVFPSSGFFSFLLLVSSSLFSFSFFFSSFSKS